jgi:hypothetical protein
MTKNKSKNELPKKVETYVDNSILFNKFGIINLNALRATTKTELSNTELKKLIKERFSKEIVGGKIEFITKEKNN